MKEEIRRPAVAGSFYPADPPTLSRQVREFLNRAPKEEIREKSSPSSLPMRGTSIPAGRRSGL